MPNFLTADRADGMPSALDVPLAVTFFADAKAHTKTESQTTLRTLRGLIETTSARRKVNLPWLKLAVFGNARTAKYSLRHNANVMAISGIEGDGDDGKLSVEQVVETLELHHIAALVYTSPSHTEAWPRWRILCPLSRQHPPESRAQFVAQLDSLLGGVLSRESYTLSQSYFFGAVRP